MRSSNHHTMPMPCAASSMRLVVVSSLTIMVSTTANVSSITALRRGRTLVRSAHHIEHLDGDRVMEPPYMDTSCMPRMI